MATTSAPIVALTISSYPADTSVDVLDVTVGDVLKMAVADSPDVLALTDGTGEPDAGRWTYAELLSEAESIAAGLLEIFEPGERVVLWSTSSAAWVHVEFALALAGITLVTANPASTEAEFAYVVHRSGAAGIIHGTDNSGRSLEPVASAVAASTPGVRRLIDIRNLPKQPAAGGSLPVVSPDDPVQIQFTSGTTGRPKGALLRHRGVANVPRFYALRSGISGSGGYVNPFPLFHTGGCVTGTLTPMWLRLNHVIMNRFDPALMLRLLADERAIGALVAPVMATTLRQRADFFEHDLSALQHVGIGAAPVSPEVIKQFERDFGCPFANTYGQTEASPVITSTPPDASPEDKALSVGLPLPQAEVRIVAADGRTPVPIGTIGEICVRGYQVMIGYDGMVDETAAAIDEAGFLHTGDLGRVDARGYVYIEGRLKDMIIKGGENIYPQEIELRLLEHPAVQQAVVFGQPDDTYGELVHAVVVPAAENTVTAAELRAWCGASLQTYKVPTAWFVTTVLPVLASGKIPKHQVVAEHARGAHDLLED
jgi:fatty-acyl-CoA synthase